MFKKNIVPKKIMQRRVNFSEILNSKSGTRPHFADMKITKIHSPIKLHAFLRFEINSFHRSF